MNNQLLIQESVRNSISIHNHYTNSIPASPQSESMLEEQQDTQLVSELIMTQHSPDLKMMLLPMIAHITHTSNRWVTCFLNEPLTKQELLSFGIDLKKIRFISMNESNDNRWLLWETLRNGNSEYVLASPGQLTDSEWEHFQAAASEGNTKGLFISKVN